MTRILVTSALPYVNNVPHLGNIVGSVLSADVFARWCRMQGRETLFVCGTDEHGAAIEIRSESEGRPPREICDRFHLEHKKIYEWFQISFDVFGRTSSELHYRQTQALFAALDERDFVSSREDQQYFDREKGRFLADRYLVGVCPRCGFADCHGDQCDGCGALVSPEELLDLRSRVSGSVPERRATRHLFLHLEKLQGQVEEWRQEAAREQRWSANAQSITRAWLEGGLCPRAITRDLKWGVPVPREGFEEKVFYVWFDAPIGYISLTAEVRSDWQWWWKCPGEVRLFQFMAKDNVPFHGVLFPAMLLGSGGNWTLPFHIDSTEYLNYEGGKFSKSRGVGVFGDDAVASGIPSDVWRYVLMATRPEGQDTEFRWEDLRSRLNNELVACLGNLVSRLAGLVARRCGGRLPLAGPLDETDEAFLSDCRAELEACDSLFARVKLREALVRAMNVARRTNKYLQDKAPWKGSEERAATTLALAGRALCDGAVALSPFLPATAKAILGAFGETERGPRERERPLVGGRELAPLPHLFSPLEASECEELRGRFGGRP